MAKKQTIKNAQPIPDTPSSSTPTGKSVKPGVVRANVHRQMVTTGTYVSLYVNDTQVQISPWDFRLMFGVISGTPTAENKTVEVTEIGEVRMSPQHAKRVAIVLLQQIKNYEQSIGPIPQPEE